LFFSTFEKQEDNRAPTTLIEVGGTTIRTFTGFLRAKITRPDRRRKKKRTQPGARSFLFDGYGVVHTNQKRGNIRTNYTNKVTDSKETDKRVQIFKTLPLERD